MKNYSMMCRRAVITAIAALIVATVALPVSAHEGNCPFCKLPVPQDTKLQDGEVALRYGRKRIEYRCVWCALVEAQTDQYKNDLTVLAPSEKKGQPIPLVRTNGKWSAPDGTVFVGIKAGHKVCPTTYRAFTNRAAFVAYIQKNADLLKDAKPLTLAEMLAIAKV